MGPKVRNKEVFVAMSGGVDSSVTAALLKERGFDARGVHIKMWSPSADSTSSPQVSSGQADPFAVVCKQQYQDRIDAMRVAAHLNIPFETWDFTKEYKKEVVEYMIREYAAGRTPNPDVMCNRHIKFGVFLKRALEQGADFVATGHYVRVTCDKRHETRRKKHVACCLSLVAARDANKDQSYFLWTLTQEQLKHCLFPIGEYTKPEVRVLAKKFGLPTAEKEESQGICFIGEINIREFLKKYIPERRGQVLTTSGKVIGEHEGLSFYTIGQREGLGIGGGIPYYVAAKDFSTNTLTVTEGPYDENLFSKDLVVTDVNWISGQEPRLPLKCEARIRYRQPLQRCRVESLTRAERTYVEKNSALVRGVGKSALLRVVFDENQRAVTPGQSAVFYQGEEMLGGGIIV